MEKNRIENWEAKKGQLKRDYPQLSSEDLLYGIGKEEELLQRLQEKTKKNKEELRKWLTLMG